MRTKEKKDLKTIPGSPQGKHRDRLDHDLDTLDDIVTAAEGQEREGSRELREEFERAKLFVFEVVAMSRGLDIHIELDNDERGWESDSEDGRRSSTGPVTPPSPRLSSVPLPQITPGSTPYHSGFNTPMGGLRGLGFKILASPMDLGPEGFSYFSPKSSPPIPVGLGILEDPNRSCDAKTPTGDAYKSATTPNGTPMTSRPRPQFRLSSRLFSNGELFKKDDSNTPRVQRSFYV